MSGGVAGSVYELRARVDASSAYYSGYRLAVEVVFTARSTALVRSIAAALVGEQTSTVVRVMAHVMAYGCCDASSDHGGGGM
jgi:hypothetical protein